MRVYSGIIIMIAIFLGIIGGGAVYYFFGNLLLALGSAAGSIFGSAFFLERFSAV